jgi:hypothetical protein
MVENRSATWGSKSPDHEATTHQGATIQIENGDNYIAHKVLWCLREVTLFA